MVVVYFFFSKDFKFVFAERVVVAIVFSFGIPDCDMTSSHVLNFMRAKNTVVILLKATKHAEREQINKSHWLNNVSRAHFIGGERLPKHQLS